MGTVEGALPGGGVRQYRAQREDVRGRSDALSEHLLRSAVPGGDRHLPGGGERQPVFGARDAEVDDARPRGGEHDVRRFQVPVHQPGRVDVPQGRGERGGESPDAVGAEGPVLADGVVEGGPGQELGGDPGPVVGVLGPRVQDPGDSGAGDRLGGVGLAQEPLGEVRVVRELRQQHLDGRGTAAVVPAEVHLAHAALAEDAEDAVRAEPDGVAGAEGFHGCAASCRSGPAVRARCPVRCGTARQRSTGRPVGSLIRFMMICELTSVTPERAVSFSIHRRSYARRSATAIRSRQPGLPKSR